MKRSFFFLSAFLSVAILQTAHAEDASFLSRISSSVTTRLDSPVPSQQVEKFILKEMRRWGENGIVLQKEDLSLVQKGDFRALCDKKKDVNDKDIAFITGGPSEKGSCLGLVSDLVTLIDRERDALALADDLLSLASSDELAIADEAGRPLDLAGTSDALRRIWSGTGSVTPSALPSSIDAEIEALKSALSQEKENLPRILLRYHFGYFRDKRERDQRLTSDGAAIGEALNAIAKKLTITGDQSKKGNRGYHVFSSLNIVLWVRQDDLGLHFITPVSFEYPELKLAGDYPVFAADHPFVAYPFDYTDTPTEPSRETPLCERPNAARGFLCRKATHSLASCALPSDRTTISLFECPPAATAQRTDACVTDVDFREDTGGPLIDPNAPSTLHSNLPRITDSATICTPEKSVIYPDTILGHLCYAQACLSTSLTEHTLIPGRNPVVADEMSMPFLACMRDDPRLGLGVEIPAQVAVRLPRYRGYDLVREVEQLYCGMNGSAPQPLLSLCSPANDDAKRVQTDQVEYATTLSREFFEGKRNRQDLEAMASVIGKQASAEQTTDVLRMLFLTLASTLNETASLFQELQNAPLTTTPCPWTGGFSSSSSSS
jgi:hypothetical protein